MNIEIILNDIRWKLYQSARFKKKLTKLDILKSYLKYGKYPDIELNYPMMYFAYYTVGNYIIWKNYSKLIY